MRPICLAILLLLESCTPQIVSGDRNGGKVTYPHGFGNRDRAFAVAAEHCHVWGKRVRVTGQPEPGGVFSFECVPP
jgi:hypothetical protein